MEDHALDREPGRRRQHLEEMPGDRLALAVLVGGEEELAGVLQQALQFGDLLPLLAVDHVERFEVVVDIDAQASPRFPFVRRGHFGRIPWQVAHVPDRRLHHEVAAEKTGDRPRLGGRLHDHERLGHGERGLAGPAGNVKQRPPADAAVRHLSRSPLNQRGRRDYCGFPCTPLAGYTCPVRSHRRCLPPTAL